MKSEDKSATFPEIEAPKILRIPISRIRCSAANDTNPNSPRQPIKMANVENVEKILPIRSSVRFGSEYLDYLESASQWSVLCQIPISGFAYNPAD